MGAERAELAPVDGALTFYLKRGYEYARDTKDGERVYSKPV